MFLDKINLVFYLSFWLCLLFLVCDDIEPNPGPIVDRRARILYANIRDHYENMGELALAGSHYDVLGCGELKFSDRRHLSELRNIYVFK